MQKIFEEIMKAFRETYGENAKIEEGETQVFVLNDCTVILSLNEGHLKTEIIGDEPIIVDYTTGFYSDQQEEE